MKICCADGDLLTPLSFSYGLHSKCADLIDHITIIHYSLNFEHFVHILFTNFSQSHHTIDTIQFYTLSIS